MTWGEGGQNIDFIVVTYFLNDPLVIWYHVLHFGVDNCPVPSIERGVEGQYAPEAQRINRSATLGQSVVTQ